MKETEIFLTTAVYEYEAIEKVAEYEDLLRAKRLPGNWKVTYKLNAPEHHLHGIQRSDLPLWRIVLIKKPSA